MSESVKTGNDYRISQLYDVHLNIYMVLWQLSQNLKIISITFDIIRLFILYSSIRSSEIPIYVIVLNHLILSIKFPEILLYFLTSYHQMQLILQKNIFYRFP